jgi:hypothetical protein
MLVSLCKAMVGVFVTASAGIYHSTLQRRGCLLRKLFGMTNDVQMQRNYG